MFKFDHYNFGSIKLSPERGKLTPESIERLRKGAFTGDNSVVLNYGKSEDCKSGEYCRSCPLRDCQFLSK